MPKSRVYRQHQARDNKRGLPVRRTFPQAREQAHEPARCRG